MALITRGMGAILKGIKNLKKSKKFPGKNAQKQLEKRGPSKGKDFLDVDSRITRTKDLRDKKASQIKEFRENKGKFSGATSNVKETIKKSKFNKPGSKVVKKEGGVEVLLKPGSKKKDLRKFKEFIKTGKRKK
tara:strand:- start:50 stop:448 length:399 start_codon:yes stop_codon:yes gene_type:complete